MWAQNKEYLQNLSPDEAFDILKQGNKRFLSDSNSNKELLKQVHQTSNGQFPVAAVLSCIDSRTSAELIFDQGLGDIFSIRIAGNVLNDDILGSLEFACGVAGSKLVVVLGHSKCGAVTGACNNFKSGFISGMLEKIKPAIEMETSTKESRNGQNQEFVNRVSEINVHYTIKQIKEKSSLLNEMEKKGTIKIVGGFYEVETGKVNFFED